jgi:hypothetical protein
LRASDRAPLEPLHGVANPVKSVRVVSSIFVARRFVSFPS